MNKRRLKPVLLLLCFLIASWGGTEAGAAEKRFLDISATTIGANKVDESDNDTHVAQKLIKVAGGLPLSLNQHDTLFLQALYQAHYLNWSSFQPTASISDDDLPESLHAMEVSAELIHGFSDRWRGMVRIAPGIKSDFEDIDERDLSVRALVSLIRHDPMKGKIGLGVSYSDLFGSPLVFPVVHLEWLPSDNWKISGTLPVNFAVAYKLSGRWKTGFDAEVKGGQYRLTEDAPWNESVLNYTEILVGPFLDWEVAPRSHLLLKGGLVTRQIIEIKDEDDADKVIPGMDFENSAYVTIGFYVSF